MRDIVPLLEQERSMERQFTEEAARWPTHDTGWSEALLFFHLYRWRERLRDSLRQLSEGQPATPPPEAIDAFNDRELREGASVSIDEATTRSQAAIGEQIDLWRRLGDRPFNWYIARTTGEAIVRNSYFHPRIHIAEHFIERGDRPRATRIFEEAVGELRQAEAPGHTLGPALCNLASARVADGRLDEALALLAEGIPTRADLAGIVANDRDFAALRDDARFQSLIKRSPSSAPP